MIISGANPFANTAGSFFLATPTSANDTDECNGIWFFDGENGNPSLVLPQPPAGWVYEGWVVDMSDPQNPMPMSTGTFTSASGPDSDGAGPYAGSDNPAPMFPGQDYVVIMPKNLCNNYTAVISIEPNPDRNPDIPFFLKPLAAAISKRALYFHSSFNKITLLLIKRCSAYHWNWKPSKYGSVQRYSTNYPSCRTRQSNFWWTHNDSAYSNDDYKCAYSSAYNEGPSKWIP
mmetsp:Transcript_12533/g.13926  ORF Transcript_12533/g.13926 Transcript_12533/m.13926 type:complete len:231 (-) Transcript_12533:128-820(-)